MVAGVSGDRVPTTCSASQSVRKAKWMGGMMATAEATENEALAHRWHMEIFNEGKLEVADEILGSEFVFHMPEQDIRGPEESKQLASALRAAFPDFQITHEDVVSSGNKVAIRWTARGTHRGTYPPPYQVPATGKEIRMRGIDFYHIANGKIAEAWIDLNEAAVLHQMGALSPIGEES
jgi:steroid delta-isomerase-like uncharacterized protein